MPCTVRTLGEVQTLVLAVIQANTGAHDVDLDTDLVARFGWDDPTFDQYYTQFLATFANRGCTFHFGPGAMRGTQTPGDIANLIWNDFRANAGE